MNQQLKYELTASKHHQRLYQHSDGFLAWFPNKAYVNICYQSAYDPVLPLHQ